MIDLHTHILPGIDDGVKSEDEAVAFARVACGDGIRTLVATPHCKDGFWVNRRDEVVERVERLRRRLRDEAVDLEVLPGAEVHICPDLVARVRDGRAPTIGDNGRTLLLELSLTQYPVDLENLVFQLKLAGIVPLLAHPERIRYFQEDVRRYEACVRLGAYGQVTTGSILGTFGETARALSIDLLRRRLVHVIASDAHNVRGRPPVLSEAVEVASEWSGEALARRMADDIPRALIEGREPDVPPPDAEPAPLRRSFLARWFGRDRS